MFDSEYWNKLYLNGYTGWDVGYATRPITEYIDQLEDRNIKILIPGAGNSYEVEYLHQKGFKNIYLLDFSEKAIQNFRIRVPGFPAENIVVDNFFNHTGAYDLILEQTFFCALNPSLRFEYAKKMAELLKAKGKLTGLLFNIDFGRQMPPFGGDKMEYEEIFTKYFNIIKMEEAYNSIQPRKGNELFILMQKK